MDQNPLRMKQPTGPSFDREEYEMLRESWGRDVRLEAEPGEYNCPACNNRGYTLIHRPDSMAFLYDPCACVGIKKNWVNIRQSGMEGLLRKYCFENFRVTEQWQEPIFRGAQDYAADPKGWILLAGQSGAGKTHLCTAICRSLAKARLRFVYMPWREEIMALKGLATDYEARQKRMDRLMKAPYLFIDDLFKSPRGQGATKSDVEHAFELLNYRYNQELPTIISTELMPGELEMLDEAVHGRIIERCGKHVYAIRADPKRNHRLKPCGS